MASTMGPKLSKAKRGKRRWIGLHVDKRYEKRHQLEEVLQQITKNMGEESKLRLYDFETGNNDHLLTKCIIVVSLEYSTQVKDFFYKNPQLGIETLTTSGKIRLVRQRMGLQKPPRRKKKS